MKEVGSTASGMARPRSSRVATRRGGERRVALAEIHVPLDGIHIPPPPQIMRSLRSRKRSLSGRI